MPAHIALCTIELFIPESHSLKEKRHEIKSIIEKIRSRTNASCAETDFHDLWQRAQLTLALVSNDKIIIEKQLSLIRNIADSYQDVETVSFLVEYI